MHLPFPPDFTRPNLCVAREGNRVTATIFGWTGTLDCRDADGIAGFTYWSAPGDQLMTPAKSDVYDAMTLLTSMRQRDAELAGMEQTPCALHLSPQAAVRLLFTGAIAKDRLDQSMSGDLPTGQAVLYLPVGDGAKTSGIQEILASPAFLGMSLAPLA